ncbi:hypothetical protein KKP3262_000005 [Enterobacter phage KKP_3262]|nr:hypothetical protein KKP3262_000005 [Enterobacter phage KKP_3262]
MHWLKTSNFNRLHAHGSVLLLPHTKQEENIMAIWTIEKLIDETARTHKANILTTPFKVGSIVRKAEDANLRCDGVIREILDNGGLVKVIVPPYLDTSDHVTMGIYAAGDFRLVRASNFVCA